MNKLKSLLFISLLFSAMAVQAGELQVGISPITLLIGTPGLHVNYRLSQSHFQLGYKYERWSVGLMNKITQVKTTNITHSRRGPALIYLLEPEAESTYYAGVELLKWTAQEHAIGPGGGSESASSNDLYFGGGRTGHWGNSLYYNFGFFLGPSADLRSPAMKSTGATSSGGSFDLQLQIGLYF